MWMQNIVAPDQLASGSSFQETNLKNCAENIFGVNTIF